MQLKQITSPNHVYGFRWGSLEDIHLSKKERANFMKKSSELGTTSDLVVVHTLIFSLWGATLIGLRKQTKLVLSFVIEQHLFWNSGSFNFLENTYSNAFDCIELCSQKVIHLFEAMKLSSYSLKLKLVSANVEEILAGGELKCLQRHLIVGQQTRMPLMFIKGRNMSCIKVLKTYMYVVQKTCRHFQVPLPTAKSR